MDKLTINISGEQVEVTVSVNKDGNLVIGGVGAVSYEMYEDELILNRVEEQE